MSVKYNSSFFANLKYDLPASIVVFLVAVPLCLGIALASGAPLFSGIIAGFVGGIVVGLLSGSSLGVSGPAAGLAVIVLTAIQDLGAFETFLLAVVLAGVIQLILGFLKAGVIGYYFPSSVIKGMLSGIGIIIILKQIPYALGYDETREWDFMFFHEDGQTTFSNLLNLVDVVTPGAIIITTVSLIILILWERPFMKKIGLFKVIQGPLVAVVTGIILNIAFQNVNGLSLAPDQLVNIPVSEALIGFFNQFTLPDFSQFNNSEVYIVAITMAVVASLETLLCVEATDKLDPQKRVTPTNRELRAQGIGNILSGLIGGLPITQVIVRSSANIQSGGRTKTSAVFHGILLLGSAIIIPYVLNLVPLASLAAILFVVGFKLAKPSIFKEIYAKGKEQFIPFIVTILGIVFTDLLIGIGLGMIVAVLYILWNDYKTPYHFNPKNYKDGEPVRIQLSDNVTFLNKARIMNTLYQMPDKTHVIIDASKTKNIHPDILEIIENFERNAKTRDIVIEMNGLEHKDGKDPVEELGHLVLKRSKSKSEKTVVI